MNTLFVGDPHLKLNMLNESKSFLDQLKAHIASSNYDSILIAGDLFDSFAVIRSEIMAMWSNFLLEVGRTHKVICLVGNHDLAGAHGGSHALEAFKAYPGVVIVDAPLAVNNMVFVPFYRDNAQFEAYCRSLPNGTILFCHQSFNGCQFENGMYDPGGADPKAVAHLQAVVSGHVHKFQTFENIVYPGTPFQHSFADAGEAKYVWEMEIATTVSFKQKFELNMPKFVNIKADSIDELQKTIATYLTDSNSSYKLIAKGTPSEIAAFWQSQEAKNFKANTKRVVDALTSMKPITAFVQVTGATQEEKLNEYIKQRTWRTDKGSLLDRAKEYIR